MRIVPASVTGLGIIRDTRFRPGSIVRRLYDGQCVHVGAQRQVPPRHPGVQNDHQAGPLHRDDRQVQRLGKLLHQGSGPRLLAAKLRIPVDLSAKVHSLFFQLSPVIFHTFHLCNLLKCFNAIKFYALEC